MSISDHNSDISEAIRVLRDGGLILYPTDTVWGIGCDATNPQAVDKVFKLKQRQDSKALITLVDSLAALERIVPEVPEVAYELIDAAVDPITIVYDHGINVAPALLAPDGSIGVRLTHERFSSELCRRLRRPIVSTSANISGVAAPAAFDQISPEIFDHVDYVCQYGRELPWADKPSTVIKISAGGLFKILRK